MTREYCCTQCGGRDFHRIERIEVDDDGRAAAFCGDGDILKCTNCGMQVQVAPDGAIQLAIASTEERL
jgi:hypothetical protein